MTPIWWIIIGLGLGTWLLRFSFLGLIGNRPLPEWVLRHLRYTAVAILPGLVAPLVIFPEVTGGSFDPPRAIAAAGTVIVGYLTKNLMIGFIAGFIILYSTLNLPVF